MADIRNPVIAFFATMCCGLAFIVIRQSQMLVHNAACEEYLVRSAMYARCVALPNGECHITPADWDKYLRIYADEGCYMIDAGSDHG